ncbi:MAG TPA: peptide ABC transporter substrate-binding protein [Chloroflexota bacterium]
MPKYSSFLAVASFVLLAACSPATSSPSSAPPEGAAGTPSRVTIAIGAELDNLATKLETGNTFASEFNFLSNSPLAVRNERGVAIPLLAAELPSQEKGTWTVKPDGTMTTNWKLRPNAQWHDGQPIIPSDFSFAFRVYTNPDVPVRERVPEQFIDQVTAIDGQSFIISWKQPYPWANELVSRQMEALPEHILAPSYERGDTDAFLNQSFWSTPDYVGDGPYRLMEWDRGSQLRYGAFDGYFMGKPRIDEVVFRVIADTNAVLANVLGGAVDATVGITLGQQGGVTVQKQWDLSQGQVVITPVRFRYVQIQLDPTRNEQPALSDPRVRRALATGIDRVSLAEVVTQGTAPATEIPVSPNDPIYPDALNAAAKYPYDPARAAALLTEAGWTRRGDQLANGAGQPFALDLRTTASSDNESEMSIIGADLGKLGMQVSETVIPQSRIRDNEYRVTFPGLNTTAMSIDVPGIFVVAISSQCATTQTRFAGSNRGCWQNSEFDRLYLVASSSLDARERAQAEVQALHVLTDDVGIIGLSYNSESIAVKKGLVGPGSRWPGQVGNTWNIHEWHWQ